MMVAAFLKGIIMYVVITGTSRGIGLELVKLGLKKEHRVLAVARAPKESKELMKLKEEHPNCELLTLDLLEKDAHQSIADAVRNWPKIDLLINNAGIYADDDSIEDFQRSFLTNTIKPFFITKALFPKLKLSERPVSLQITSQMGSISDNESGGSYSYRSSKAALNMLYKSLSVDQKWLISLLVHPGWVQTRMGGESAPLSVNDSALGIWKLAESATISQSGSFLNYRGERLHW